MKLIWADPELRRQARERSKALMQSPEHQKKWKEGMMKYHRQRKQSKAGEDAWA